MKKSFIVLLALVLIVGIAVGGTVAWLTATSNTVTNTFTTSDVDISLSETTGDSYKMVPGAAITKDPKVTVTNKTDVDIYLFVKVEKSSNFDDFMSYEMAEGWTALTDVSGVYYREVKTTDTTKEFAVIKNNTVSVKNTVTKENMEALKQADYPTLKVTAYACQKEGFTSASAAWTTNFATT